MHTIWPLPRYKSRLSNLLRRAALADLPQAPGHRVGDSAVVEMLPQFDAMTFRVLQASELTLAVGIGPDGDRRRLDS